MKADPSLALGALQLSYSRGNVNVKVEPRPTCLTMIAIASVELTKIAR